MNKKLISQCDLRKRYSMKLNHIEPAKTLINHHKKLSTIVNVNQLLFPCATTITEEKPWLAL